MYIDIFRLVLDSDDRTAGMTAMVAKLSAEKPVRLTAEAYADMVRELEELKERLLEGAVRDNEAFLGIRAAYALPKETDGQKETRRQAICDAAWHAALVPKENGACCRRVYELACRLEGSSNPACLSDLMSAKYLAAAGVRGCALNIDANLPMVKDGERTAALETAREALLKDI